MSPRSNHLQRPRIDVRSGPMTGMMSVVSQTPELRIPLPLFYLKLVSAQATIHLRDSKENGLQYLLSPTLQFLKVTLKGSCSRHTHTESRKQNLLRPLKKPTKRCKTKMRSNRFECLTTHLPRVTFKPPAILQNAFDYNENILGYPQAQSGSATRPEIIIQTAG